MHKIAIIPARSGSKGLPHKNILPIIGKPLMSYTIEAAIQSNCFDLVFVSTDCRQYADIAREFGADASFLRSANTSGDSASTWDAVNEVLTKLKSRGKTFDVIAVLQPTSPLRNSRDIQQAMKLFDEKNADFVASVCEMEHSPLWSNTLDKSLSLNNFIKPEHNIRRQLLPLHYRINGAIYLIRATKLDSLDNLYSEGSFAYIMPIERSVDIDSLIDMKIAEILLQEIDRKTLIPLHN